MTICAAGIYISLLAVSNSVRNHYRSTNFHKRPISTLCLETKAIVFRYTTIARITKESSDSSVSTVRRLVTL